MVVAAGVVVLTGLVRCVIAVCRSNMELIRSKQQALVMAVAHNQAFLDAVVRAQRGTTGYPLPPEPDRSAAGIAKIRSSQPTTAPRYFSKAKSSLHQLVREWASEGAAERASCYGVLLAQLQRFLPVTDANRYAACSARSVVPCSVVVAWSCGHVVVVV